MKSVHDSNTLEWSAVVNMVCIHSFIQKSNCRIRLIRYSEKNKSPDFVAIASRGPVGYLSVIQ